MRLFLLLNECDFRFGLRLQFGKFFLAVTLKFFGIGFLDCPAVFVPLPERFRFLFFNRDGGGFGLFVQFVNDFLRVASWIRVRCVECRLCLSKPVLQVGEDFIVCLLVHFCDFLRTFNFALRAIGNRSLNFFNAGFRGFRNGGVGFRVGFSHFRYVVCR